MADEIEQPDADEADTPAEDALPTHKDDLVALAIERRIPSYVAWEMTIPELKKKLES